MNPLPAGPFGVIYADPPWRFEPWSRITGMGRAAEKYYATMTLALQHDESLSAECKCNRLERIIDYALRLRQVIDPGGMLPARIRLEIVRRALSAELEEKARITARGDHDSDE